MRAKGTRDGTEEYVDRGAARVFRSVLVEAETKDFAGSPDGHVVIAGRNPTRPGTSCAPAWPSSISSADRALKCFASKRVNNGGMCCTITTGTGKSAGR